MRIVNDHFSEMPQIEMRYFLMMNIKMRAGTAMTVAIAYLK